MDRRKRRDEIIDFNSVELEIVQEFLSGKSIRQLVEIYEGFGRTAIKNILTDYAKACPEVSDKIEERLRKNKTHREKEPADESQEKSANNSKSKKDGSIYLEISALSEDEKKAIIFEKLNSERIKHGKKAYSDVLLERKYSRIRDFFIVTRNLKIENPEEKLLLSDFEKMLFDTPSLLGCSLSDKIVPMMKNLDEHPNVGYKNANYIIRENSAILASSISRTNLQLRILQDNNLLRVFLEKPRYFRTSPEMMYALIKLYSLEDKSVRKDVFITKNQLQSEYGMSGDELKEKYKIEEDEKYKNDEYFDK